MSANRKDIKLIKSSIKEVLPEYFSTNYPNLVSFLELYYQTLDGDTKYSFNTKIKSIYGNRDIIGTDIENLKKIMYEMTVDVDMTSLVTDYRLKTLRLANYYRNKGSLVGFKEFFRWLFNEDIEVEYGKNSCFIVGESNIGAQSLKYIKNAELYQTYALLIKSGRSVSQWRDIYKEFCHPAGFYFQGQVVVESYVDLGLSSMPYVWLDSDSGLFTVENSYATITPMALTSITGIYADDNDLDNEKERLDLNLRISAYSDLTIEQLNSSYDTIEELLDANSPTFDDISVNFSSTIETFDQSQFDL